MTGWTGVGTGHNFYWTPGVYNLQGGVLETSSISLGGLGYNPLCSFNFTAGTLQAAAGEVAVGGGTGLSITMPITVGTAASNVATVDANGQTATLDSSTGYLTGPGQLRVIDSTVGGGMVVLGNALPNTYTGGTTVLSGTLQVLNATTALPSVGVVTVGGPVSLVSRPGWNALRRQCRGTSNRPGKHGRGARKCQSSAARGLGDWGGSDAARKRPGARPRTLDAGPAGRGLAGTRRAGLAAGEGRLTTGER